MRTLFAAVLVAAVSLSASRAGAADAIAHVEKRGDGPITMILIPGSPCDWRVWDEFMTRNSERYTMHAVTLAGFSGTEPLPMPDENTTSPTPWFDTIVDDLAAYIKNNDMQGCVVVGHSLGGHLALRLGVEHPDVVSKIVDVDGVPAANFGGDSLTPEMRIAYIESQLAPQLRNMEEQKAIAMQEEAARQMVTDAERGEELAGMFVSTDYAVAIEYLLQGLKSDIAADLKNLKAPTLAIVAVGQAGTNDEARSQVRAQWVKWTQGAGAITLKYYEDSKHFVMDDQPEKLDKDIAAFLGAE